MFNRSYKHFYCFSTSFTFFCMIVLRIIKVYYDFICGLWNISITHEFITKWICISDQLLYSKQILSVVEPLFHTQQSISISYRTHKLVLQTVDMMQKALQEKWIEKNINQWKCFLKLTWKKLGLQMSHNTIIYRRGIMYISEINWSSEIDRLAFIVVTTLLIWSQWKCLIYYMFATATYNSNNNPFILYNDMLYRNIISIFIIICAQTSFGKIHRREF